MCSVLSPHHGSTSLATLPTTALCAMQLSPWWSTTGAEQPTEQPGQCSMNREWRSWKCTGKLKEAECSFSHCNSPTTPKLRLLLLWKVPLQVLCQTAGKSLGEKITTPQPWSTYQLNEQHRFHSLLCGVYRGALGNALTCGCKVSAILAL